MKTILNIIENYTKDKHEKTFLKHSTSHVSWSVKSIFNNLWKNEENGNVPYELITHILDSYYHVPHRPDLAFNFCWQAINNSYNELIIHDSSKKRLLDSVGIKLLISKISANYDAKYKLLLEPYFEKVPKKLYNYVASFLLKGYAIESAGFDDKFNNSAYGTFCNNNSDLAKLIKDTYGESYKKLTGPTLEGTKVSMNIDESNKHKAHDITRSLASKLELLMKSEVVTFSDSTKTTNKKYSFSTEERIRFAILSILYASRCNNFHGNVAARLNSIYADSNTYKSYKYMYLLGHMVLAVSMNINGYLEDSDLHTLSVNTEFLNFA
ncbi:hypothetical protein [Paenibacillus pabuli]|uniref:hypothetical protein n=1 Tax=Paenibacillus pabuli TaxID=1472 RepID=UPI001FFFDCF5|nr:hypothetical protein [Paenibacillus pabuli]UPK45479.1 hypothetical protein KET34_08460 [Paenibacillus pabuli]